MQKQMPEMTGDYWLSSSADSWRVGFVDESLALMSPPGNTGGGASASCTTVNLNFLRMNGDHVGSLTLHDVFRTALLSDFEKFEYEKMKKEKFWLPTQ